MTLAEFANVTGYKEESILHNFPRIKEQLAKRDIEVVKTGRGKNADFEIYYTKINVDFSDALDIRDRAMSL